MTCHITRILGSTALSALLVLPALADTAPPLATLSPPPVPADNPMSAEKVELGEKLFWDGRLSGNGAMPCSACHLPDLGWGTGGAISFGYPGTQHWRNSQTILNSAYYNKLFWEGSATSLEAQAPAAAGGAVAGNGDGSTKTSYIQIGGSILAADTSNRMPGTYTGSVVFTITATY